MVGDMVPDGVWDGWEAALVALADDRDFANPKKGTGAAFAIGVTRDQALAEHARLLEQLRAFRATVDADLAALLHEEMRECLRLYEARKQEAGALDFLDLLIKARDLVRDNQDDLPRIPRAIPRHSRRRVPGHRSAASRSAAHARRRR